MKAHADIYQKFLRLTSVPPSKLEPLDPLEARIADFVALAQYKSEPLSVRGLMVHDELASPATLHSRLKSMCRKGWLVLADTEDGRRKQVELTPAALRHLAWLSECIVKALDD